MEMAKCFFRCAANRVFACCRGEFSSVVVAVASAVCNVALSVSLYLALFYAQWKCNLGPMKVNLDTRKVFARISGLTWRHAHKTAVSRLMTVFR